MLKRKIESSLHEWKQKKNHKCLVVLGARQVGKTFSVREFGRKEYGDEHFFELNFKVNATYKKAFQDALDVDTIIFNLSLLFPGKKLISENTLLFFDEIQECPQALTALKFFSEDGRYDVIASGSLLGIDNLRESSYPVGYVDYFFMKSLDFEEFLWALDVTDEQISKIRQYFSSAEPVPQAANDVMQANFRLYMTLGGMPEVVSLYLDGRDMVAVDEKQRAILRDYQFDIAHLSDSREIKLNAEKCYLSIANQLSKDNPKFQYKLLEKGGNARKYGNSLTWLSNAFLTIPVYNVTKVEYSLETYKLDDNFRIYPTDIGLLMAMFDYGIKEKIIYNTIEGNTKGAVYEAAIAESLYKNNISKQYFYKNDTQRVELEFLYMNKDGVIPVEVKAGRGSSETLNRYLKHNDIPYGYKLTDGNVGREGKKITLPHYMVMFLG